MGRLIGCLEERSSKHVWFDSEFDAVVWGVRGGFAAYDGRPRPSDVSPACGEADEGRSSRFRELDRPCAHRGAPGSLRPVRNTLIHLLACLNTVLGVVGVGFRGHVAFCVASGDGSEPFDA